MISKGAIFSRVMEAGGRLKVRSALNPILWLCAIITIPSLVILGQMKSIPTWLVGLICAPVMTAIIGFLFLLLFDRDKLQSEDYQLKKREMELVQQKGDPKALPAGYFKVIEPPIENKITAE